MIDPLGHLVLHRPEIPNNTGTIGRMCVALGLGLHLVHPLAFDVTDRAVRRSGLDYWPRMPLAEHRDWKAFERCVRPERIWLLCAHGSRPLHDAGLKQGDFLILGSETSGLPAALTRRHADRCVTLPMLGGERSLNLAVAAAMAAGELARQVVGRGDAHIDADGRLTVGRPEVGRGGDGRDMVSS